MRMVRVREKVSRNSSGFRFNVSFVDCTSVFVKSNFAGLQAHRKRWKSARASPTPHHTLNEERTARFTAQPLSALVATPQKRQKNPTNSETFTNIWQIEWNGIGSMKFETVRIHFLNIFGLLSYRNSATMATWRNDFCSLFSLDFVRLTMLLLAQYEIRVELLKACLKTTANNLHKFRSKLFWKFPKVKKGFL